MSSTPALPRGCRLPSSGPPLLPASIVLLALGILAITPAGAGELAQASSADHLVADITVHALPEPLRAFLNAQGSSLHDALARAGETDNLGADGRPPESCYLMLDVAAPTLAPAARRQAVAAFPLDTRAVHELMRAQGQAKGGTLPWALMTHYAKLVEAFRAQQPDAIITTVGPVVRLSTRAALPLNTTVNLDGSLTAHLRWPAGQLAPAAPHRNVRQRLQVETLGQLRERLATEAQVWPGRVETCPIPLKAVFDTLAEANAALDGLLEVDRAVTAELGITDAAGFVAAAEPYYTRVTTRAAPLLEDRIEAGALLAARLILSAWVEAGAPNLEMGTRTSVPETNLQPATSPGAPDSEKTTTPPTETAEERFLCASRSSKVFHYSDCYHVRRIKPEYLIKFESCEEAKASGRKPCKACKPCSEPETVAP